MRGKEEPAAGSAANRPATPQPRASSSGRRCSILAASSWGWPWIGCCAFAAHLAGGRPDPLDSGRRTDHGRPCDPGRRNSQLRARGRAGALQPAGPRAGHTGIRLERNPIYVGMCLLYAGLGRRAARGSSSSRCRSSSSCATAWSRARRPISSGASTTPTATTKRVSAAGCSRSKSTGPLGRSWSPGGQREIGPRHRRPCGFDALPPAPRSPRLRRPTTPSSCSANTTPGPGRWGSPSGPIWCCRFPRPW